MDKYEKKIAKLKRRLRGEHTSGLTLSGTQERNKLENTNRQGF